MRCCGTCTTPQPACTLTVALVPPCPSLPRMNERKEYKLSKSHSNRELVVRFPVKITAMQGQARARAAQRSTGGRSAVSEC